MIQSKIRANAVSPGTHRVEVQQKMSVDSGAMATYKAYPPDYLPGSKCNKTSAYPTCILQYLAIKHPLLLASDTF